MQQTVAEIEEAIERLDEIIAAAEALAPHLDADSWQEFMALKQRRHELRLLRLARSVENNKKVVSLDRWRHGFDGSSETPDPAS